MKYLLCFVFSLIFAPVYAQPFKPLLHLTTGETYYMSSSGTTELTQSIRGRENKVKVGLSFIMAFKVTGKTDSVYNMEVHYRAIDMNLHMQDTTINMNSARQENADTASLIMAAIVNKPFNIVLTVRGKVIAVKNLDKIFLDAFDNFRQ
ncbi:DUF6263 family protein, partial [uncultured Mucilaginibacter sp.]|uniref:DUF6263 family protein n=1 Tax=uncultured Mucilaginibacter sp. TaxID=797541 RepID=UPI0025D6054A